MKKKIVWSIILIVLAAAVFFGWKIFGPTISAPDGKYLYIKTGSTYSDVKQALIDKKIINSTFFFEQVAKKLNYPTLIKAGRYEIKNGMSVFNLVRMLRAGNQSPVNLVINKLRLKEDLAAKISKNFECDSLSVINYLNSAETFKAYGLDSNTLMTAVIPNTYSILWNSSPEKIFKKLYSDQQKWWTEERIKKATALNLSPKQVYTLASIVEEETNNAADKGKVASVYLNRLEIHMPLGADPTIKFALRNFGLKRVKDIHKNAAASSPYDTYFKTGLPPGPICTPSPTTIDAVLNAPATNYLYFVAQPNWSGLSNFTDSYETHKINAKNYQHFLDSINIK